MHRVQGSNWIIVIRDMLLVGKRRDTEMWNREHWISGYVCDTGRMSLTGLEEWGQPGYRGLSVENLL